MNRELLLEKRAAVEKKFNELQEQQKQGTEELVRLQGEYRLVNELLEKPDDSPLEGEIVDANTITVEEPEE